MLCSAIRGWQEHLTQIRSTTFQICRYFNSAEVSTALRPFYFAVHPDLFGQYPEERLINENSLKTLSGYLETVERQHAVKPVELVFYLRPSSNRNKRCLQSVRVVLGERSLRRTVLSILESCNLPTAHIKPPPKEVSFKKIRNSLSKREVEFYENDPVIGAFIKKMRHKVQEDDHLIPWLEKNHATAREYLKACQPIMNEIERLKYELCNDIGLKKITWESGWNISHFRGALQSFQAMFKHHPNAMSSLKGKTLIFGSDTGVNLDGHIMLNCGEVRHNWLDVLKKVELQDEVLLRLPAFEKAVSRVLRDIQVVHRKFQPKVMAGQYENQLRRLTTSLSDFQGRHGYPRHWPPNLSKFQLVVETEAGPLMLSPTGQFIVPSSCPAFLLVNFISEHMEDASRLLEEYQRNKLIEDKLVSSIASSFNLSSLRKDDNITPTLMISFCEKILEHERSLRPLLNSVSVFVTTYYSLLTDGQLCIPWNWKI